MKNIFYLVCLAMIIIVVAITKDGNSQVLKKGATLTTLAGGFTFTEGPAKAPNGDIFFTDQPNNKILKWDVRTERVSVFLEPSGRSNGLYFDAQDHLISCADENNQMWRIDKQGKHTVLIKDLDGAILNAPNDLWIDERGGIYFSDPLYKRPYWSRVGNFLEHENVYYRSPEGIITTVIDDFVRPNGLIGDTENKRLYVADIGDDKIWVYDIIDHGKLGSKHLFAAMGSDGMTIDCERNIYLTNKKGVYVFNPEGEQIELIEVPEKWTANVTIGGKKNKTLYITAMGGFYSIDLKVKGLY